ncbi:hypothetical protein [Rhizobium sp.]|uniref:hypothetical protein n=1 Tax=Rhizobium sp. TaxID=391 RepID=UPI0034C5DA79
MRAISQFLATADLRGFVGCYPRHAQPDERLEILLVAIIGSQAAWQGREATVASASREVTVYPAANPFTP